MQTPRNDWRGSHDSIGSHFCRRRLNSSYLLPASTLHGPVLASSQCHYQFMASSTRNRINFKTHTAFWRFHGSASTRCVLRFGVDMYPRLPRPQGHPRARQMTLVQAELSRGVIGTSVQWNIVWDWSILLCCCRDVPRNPTCTQTKWSSLQLTHTHAAVVLVWTFRQLCGWINMREKCCQASEQLEASEECAAKRLLVTKLFWAVGKEKQQAALKRSPESFYAWTRSLKTVYRSCETA